MDRQVWVITHSDLDGMCAGAIVKSVYPNATPMITNYGKFRSLYRIKPGDLVFITDFTLDLPEYQRLLSKGIEVVWIDHHEANYELLYEQDATTRDIPGIRRNDYCGAALTWMYFHPNMPAEMMPTIVKLTNDYDLWKFVDPRTKDMSYGLGLWDVRPGIRSGDLFWKDVLSNDPTKLNLVLKYGEHIRKYVEFRDETYCKDLAYYTTLQTPEGPKKLVAMAIRAGNSSVFDRTNKDGLDAVFTGQYVANIQRYRCSMYSPDNIKPILEIVKMFGGGGHPNAAGFQTDVYPIPTPEQKTPTAIDEAIAPYQKLLEMRRNSIILRQWCDRNSSISMKAEAFHVKDFAGFPTIAINHQFLPDVLAVSTTASDCINAETSLVAKIYLGFCMTNSGWFRCCAYPTDGSTSLDSIKDKIRRCCPDCSDTLTELEGGIWWYQRDCPVRPPISAPANQQQARM